MRSHVHNLDLRATRPLHRLPRWHRRAIAEDRMDIARLLEIRAELLTDDPAVIDRGLDDVSYAAALRDVADLLRDPAGRWSRLVDPPAPSA